MPSGKFKPAAVPIAIKKKAPVAPPPGKTRSAIPTGIKGGFKSKFTPIATKSKPVAKSKPTYATPTPKAKPSLPAAPMPKSKSFLADAGAYGKEAYTGAGSSGVANTTGTYGGARSGASTVGGNYGSTSATTRGDYAPVGGNFGSTTPSTITAQSSTPSQVAQLALANLAGRGNAAGVTRRRNRAGAGNNLSLSPEQLRNIAARRVGG